MVGSLKWIFLDEVIVLEWEDGDIVLEDPDVVMDKDETTADTDQPAETYQPAETDQPAETETVYTPTPGENIIAQNQVMGFGLMSVLILLVCGILVGFEIFKVWTHN